MRVRLITLNPELADLPFNATRQPRPFGHVARTVAETDDPEQLHLRLPEVVSGGVVVGLLAEQPARLMMTDVDSTLTTAGAIDLLAGRTDTGELVVSITEWTMYGELGLAEPLWERVVTLQGLPVRVFDKVLPYITLLPGARELVAALYEAGVLVGVTSGGFATFVTPLTRELGPDFFNANELEIHDRVLTGWVIGTAMDRDQKAHDLIRFVVALRMPLEYAVAVGDDTNGLGILATARLGVTYRAEPVAAARVDAVISFPRLDAVTVLALLRGIPRAGRHLAGPPSGKAGTLVLYSSAGFPRREYVRSDSQRGFPLQVDVR